jgi:polar amino acid transport system substrate-binding protein
MGWVNRVAAKPGPRAVIRFAAVAAAAVVSIAGWGIPGPQPAAGAAACRPKIGRPSLAQDGVLIAAMNPTVPPIQYVDKDGTLKGLDVDFGNEIARRLCLRLQLQSMQFASMIPAVKDGRIDMIDSFMYYTEQRASQVLMIPYGADTLSIVVPQSITQTITGPEDFSGKRFAVELGTVDMQDAQAADQKLRAAGKPGIDIHTFANYADVLQAIRAGQADGGFVPTEEAFYYQKQGLTFFRVALTGYDPHAEALAFRDRALAEAVAGVLNDMKQDGTMDRLFGSYHSCALAGPYKITSGPLAPPVCKNLGQ